jgi:two-component system LytT family sensor kinase
MEQQQLLEKDRICWDDKWAMVVSIPIISLLIPYVFFGIRFTRPPQLTFPIFVSTLIISTVIWIGNRAIMIWSRNKYPQMGQLKKRLLIQSLLMFLFTLTAGLGVGLLLEDFSNMHSAGISQNDEIIGSINSSLFTTIAITSIYEVIYFSQQLRDSLTQSELLKREGLRAELNALKTQVNPHFLFNNLNTLCAIIPEDSERSVQFVEQLSKVYRYILEVKDEKSIPLSDELKIMQAYAFLLNTRFGESFQLTLDIPPSEMNMKIVPFSLQLLLENALKHNVVSKEHPLHVTMTAVKGQLIIQNNLQKKLQVEQSTGIGLKNIRNRYKLLTDKLVSVTETPEHFTVSLPLI